MINDQNRVKLSNNHFELFYHSEKSTLSSKTDQFNQNVCSQQTMLFTK